MSGGDPWFRRKKVMIPIGVLGFLAVAGTLANHDTEGTAATAGAAPTGSVNASTPTVPRTDRSASTVSKTTARHGASGRSTVSAVHPDSLQGFLALAGSGDATAIRPFASETLGTPDCPVPDVYATAKPGLTVNQLEADMAAFFVQRGYQSRCRAALFLFHKPSDKHNNGFNAGRVFLDRNVDGSHNLAVDIGSVQDTYDIKDTFSFDF